MSDPVGLRSKEKSSSAGSVDCGLDDWNRGLLIL